MKRKFKILFRLMIMLTGMVTLYSCEDLVSDGLLPEYGETDALLDVSAQKDTFGIIGDTIRFNIHAESTQNIRSFSIEAQYQGESGTKITYIDVDPFIDHAFGTIQNNTKTFQLVYSYVIPADANKVRIEFKLTDESGKITKVQNIAVVDDVAEYNEIVLHSSNNYETDGFSSFNGEAYQNLKLFEAVSEVNRDVQENLDIVFLTDKNTQSAILAAPRYGLFSSGMTIKNRTNLLLLPQMTDELFESIEPGRIKSIVPVSDITEADSYAVSDLKVGDYVGFVTDFNATNSYKVGVLKVTSLHRSSCDWYDGTTFMIEFDVKVEVSE